MGMTDGEVAKRFSYSDMSVINTLMRKFSFCLANPNAVVCLHVRV